LKTDAATTGGIGLFALAFFLGLLTSTIGVGGIISGKGLFSGFRYETFQYKKGTPESAAHHILDQALDANKQQQSWTSRLTPSIFQSDEQQKAQETQRMAQQFLSQLAQSQSGQYGFGGQPSSLLGKAAQAITPSDKLSSFIPFMHPQEKDNSKQWSELTKLLSSQQEETKHGFLSDLTSKVIPGTSSKSQKSQDESELEQLKRLLGSK